MSNTTKAYFNGLNVKKGKYGLKLTGKADRIIEEVKKHANAQGYLNLELKEKKEPDQWGNTHYLQIDTWEPQQKAQAKEEHGDLPF